LRFLEQEQDAIKLDVKVLTNPKMDEFTFEVCLENKGPQPSKHTWTVQRSREDVGLFYKRVRATGTIFSLFCVRGEFVQALLVHTI